MSLKWEVCSARVWCQCPWRDLGCIAKIQLHPGEKMYWRCTFWERLCCKNRWSDLLTKVRINRSPRNQSGYPCCFKSRTYIGIHICAHFNQWLKLKWHEFKALGGFECYLTRAVVSPAAQSVVAAGWFGISKATQATKEGVTDLDILDSRYN